MRLEHEVGTYLFRKVHPPQELLEPRVIPQRVEGGIHLDENQVPVPLFVGLFQPVERLLFLLREPPNVAAELRAVRRAPQQIQSALLAGWCSRLLGGGRTRWCLTP